MFNFEANIVKRRRISKSSLFYGLLAAAALGYMGLTYLELGQVPFLEKLISQIGLNDYMSWIYLGVLALLVVLIFPALHTIFRKKTVVGGKVSFDEANLEIIKGVNQRFGSFSQGVLHDTRFGKYRPWLGTQEQGDKKGFFMTDVNHIQQKAQE